MRSTFHSLETARRALMAQQAALQTTSHNIANANTPGYSRQRVNLTVTSPYATPGMNSSVSPGQIGTGVEAGTVQRMRQDFLDLQFRGENTKTGYWQARSEALSKMEDIMKEPSDDGLAEVLNRFWNSLQDLASDPENEGTRAVVKQRGIAVADTFHYLTNSLQNVRADIQNQLQVTVKEVNTLARQINSLNEQISQVEPHGKLANDLYDKRDLLVDQLSELVNVKVSESESGGNALDIAEGRYTIEIVTNTGQSYTLVDGENMRFKRLSANFDPVDGTVQFSLNGTTIAGSVAGKLQGLADSNNSTYPDMIHSLDEMAAGFVDKFNQVHQSGFGLDGNSGYLFFNDLGGTVQGAAEAISLSSDVLNDLGHIAASSNGDNGDNGNALKLSEVLTEPLTIDNKTTDLYSYYEGVIGGMGVEAQEAKRLADNSLTLRMAAEKRRQSVSGVSIDEEMVNIIKFQHAYNAAGRMVTVVDQTLDRIINQMGIVGR
ncbi:MAG TPA: flagellar hook-associated protein FlgK [Bacillales bacterium]|nr:flagellar hook-associated protein FlgK [Bacillales bacterium]